MRFALGKHLAAPLALAAAVVFWGAPRADAAFQVTLTANGMSDTVEDGEAGFDSDGMVNGEIQITSLTVGGYQFTFTLSSNNSPGTQTLSFVDATTARVQNVSGGTGSTTVSIYASAPGFVLPTPLADATTSGTIAYLAQTPDGSVADPVTIESYIDTTNAMSTVPTGTKIGEADGSIQAGVDPVVSLLSKSTNNTASPTPYTLNLLLSAFLTSPTERPAGGNTNSVQTTIDLDGSVELSNVVPEPSTLAMAVLGLPLLGVGAYRRMRRARQA